VLYGSKGCRTDFIAVHFYECNGTTDATAEAAANDMMTFLDKAYTSFGKPLWLVTAAEWMTKAVEQGHEEAQELVTEYAR
jgi:hypothetical protein